MQNPLSSFRRTSFALALLLAVAPPLHADNNNPPQDQAADKNDKGGKKKDPSSLRGLPNADIGRTPVDSNLSTTGSDRSDRATTPPGSATAGSAAQARENAANGLNESASQRPGFNQGFDSVDKAELEKQAEEYKRNNGNPLTAVTGGRRNDGAGPTGVAGQGTAAISTGVTSASSAKDGPDGVSATLKSPAPNSRVTNIYSSVGSGPAAEILRQTEGFGTPAAAPATPAAPATVEPPLNTSANPNVKVHPSGSVTETSNNGNTKTHTTADGNQKTVVTTDPKTGTTTVIKSTTTNADGTTTTTTTSQTNAGTSCQGIDGCNDAAARAEFLRNNPASAAQVNQARNGAADSTVNPNREGNVAIDRSVALPTTSQVGRNLFGQPGMSGLNTDRGADGGGVDFNGSAGAIDPGDDAVIAGRGRQDDPGDVFNNQPGPQSGAVQAPPSSSDCEEKKPVTKRLTTVGTSKTVKKDDCAK